MAWDLKAAQMEAGVDFPVHLSREAGGMVSHREGLGMGWDGMGWDGGGGLASGSLNLVFSISLSVLNLLPTIYLSLFLDDSLS